jgi:ubiquinone/menaquinone biosynthesis C-methylase UbiE
MAVQVNERANVTDISRSTEALEDIARYRFACRFASARNLIDVACGTGYGTHLLIEEGGARSVVGVDFSPVAIRSCMHFFVPGRSSFCVASVERLPFHDAHFDAAVSLETIEHVVEPLALLRELRRVVRPAGTVVVSTPLNNSESRFKPENPYHTREYSAQEFKHLLSSVFQYQELNSQLTAHEYEPACAVVENSTAGPLVRRWIHQYVPLALRHMIRGLLGSKGRHPARSEILPGYHENAAYQIAVCT